MQPVAAIDSIVRRAVERVASLVNRDVATIPVLGGTDNTPPFRFRRWLFARCVVESPWWPELGPVATVLAP